MSPQSTTMPCSCLLILYVGTSWVCTEHKFIWCSFCWHSWKLILLLRSDFLPVFLITKQLSDFRQRGCSLDSHASSFQLFHGGVLEMTVALKLHLLVAMERWQHDLFVAGNGILSFSVPTSSLLLCPAHQLQKFLLLAPSTYQQARSIWWRHFLAKWA